MGIDYEWFDSCQHVNYCSEEVIYFNLKQLYVKNVLTLQGHYLLWDTHNQRFKYIHVLAMNWIIIWSTLIYECFNVYNRKTWYCCQLTVSYRSGGHFMRRTVLAMYHGHAFRIVVVCYILAQVGFIHGVQGYWTVYGAMLSGKHGHEKIGFAWILN